VADLEVWLGIFVNVEAGEGGLLIGTLQDDRARLWLL